MPLLYKAFHKLAPRRFVDSLCPPYATLSYSQEGEDRVVERILGHRTSGFYVDVGAFHPIQYSNTFAFYNRGWRGINIDARPGSMELFNRVRPRDINLELAISDQPQLLTYYELNEPAMNGFHEATAFNVNGAANKIVGTRKIQTVTLAEVLDKHLPPGQAIDFMNVDAEGLDEAVLRSNNWSKYRPRLILAEHLGMQTLKCLTNSSLNAFLDQQGYDLFAKTMNTLIFRQRS